MISSKHHLKQKSCTIFVNDSMLFSLFLENYTKKQHIYKGSTGLSYFCLIFLLALGLLLLLSFGGGVGCGRYSSESLLAGSSMTVIVQ